MCLNLTCAQDMRLRLNFCYGAAQPATRGVATRRRFHSLVCLPVRRKRYRAFVCGIRTCVYVFIYILRNQLMSLAFDRGSRKIWYWTAEIVFCLVLFCLVFVNFVCVQWFYFIFIFGRGLEFLTENVLVLQGNDEFNQPFLICICHVLCRYV